jgi:hypothetical protein
MNTKTSANNDTVSGTITNDLAINRDDLCVNLHRVVCEIPVEHGERNTDNPLSKVRAMEGACITAQRQAEILAFGLDGNVQREDKHGCVHFVVSDRFTDVVKAVVVASTQYGFGGYVESVRAEVLR